jgi:hypothetical protein
MLETYTKHMKCYNPEDSTHHRLLLQSKALHYVQSVEKGLQALRIYGTNLNEQKSLKSPYVQKLLLAEIGTMFV